MLTKRHKASRGLRQQLSKAKSGTTSSDSMVLIIRIRPVFCITIRPSTNTLFSLLFAPNRIQIEYSVQPIKHRHSGLVGLIYWFLDTAAFSGSAKCLRFSHWMTLCTLMSGFSIANQIKFDLRFTDLWSTWCSELIVDQLCFVFPWIFDLQLRDRRLADPPSTEPTFCQSDWLTAYLNLRCCAKLPSMRCEWTP